MLVISNRIQVLNPGNSVFFIFLTDHKVTNSYNREYDHPGVTTIGHDVVNYKNNLDRLMIVIVLVCIIYGAIWYYNRRKERKTA